MSMMMPMPMQMPKSDSTATVIILVFMACCMAVVCPVLVELFFPKTCRDDEVEDNNKIECKSNESLRGFHSIEENNIKKYKFTCCKPGIKFSDSDSEEETEPEE